jgi:hypothetical protein
VLALAAVLLYGGFVAPRRLTRNQQTQRPRSGRLQGFLRDRNPRERIPVLRTTGATLARPWVSASASSRPSRGRSRTR